MPRLTEMTPSSPGAHVSYYMDTYYYMLPQQTSAHREGTLSQKINMDERARLDVAFLRDLWLLLHVATEEHPVRVLVSELAFIASCQALALWLLPVPASFTTGFHHPLGVPAIGVAMALTLVIPLHDYCTTRERQPLRSHLRQRSLPLLFCSVQFYNVAGFFISIMPSLIYQALTASPRECASLPALLLRALCYISAVTVAKSTMSLAQSGVALLWREALTRHVHRLYVRDGTHYLLGLLLDPPLDNPDQRIARELEVITTNTMAM